MIRNEDETPSTEGEPTPTEEKKDEETDTSSE